MPVVPQNPSHIPYSPVPDTPSQIGRLETPSVHEDVTGGAAFGVGIGKAIEGLGVEGEKASDELWKRAMAVQELRNETEAREAATKYALGEEDSQSKFMASLGTDASNNLQSHIQNADARRKAIRDSLSNDAARRMFDAESFNTLRYNVNHATGHAAQQQKQAYLDSLSSERKAAMGVIARAPKDEAMFQETLKDAQDKARKEAVARGPVDDQVVAHHVADATSEAWENRLSSMADTDPFTANKLLNGNINVFTHGEKLRELTEKITRKTHEIVGRNGASAVNAGFAPYMTHVDIDRAAGVNSALMEVVKEAQRANPDLRFTIGDQGGVRTLEQQKVLVRRGVSRTLQSNHLDGRAIDLIPMGPDGKPNYDAPDSEYRKIIAAMDAASAKLGIPLGKRISWDLAHHDLPRGYDIRNAPKPVEESERSRVDRAQRWARATYPDDPVMPEVMADAVRKQFHAEKEMDRDDSNRRDEAFTSMLMKSPGEIPTTMEQIRATPEGKDLLNKAPATQQKKWLNWLSTIGKHEFAPTEEAYRRYRELSGMLQSDLKEDQDKVLDMGYDEIMKEHMPQAWRTQLLERMGRLLKKSDDPQLASAIFSKAKTSLAPMMQDAGIDPKDDKERYWRFIDGLRGVLIDFQQQHRRGPNPTEMGQIGARLMHEEYAGDFFFGLFKQQRILSDIPISDEVHDDIKAQLEAGGQTANESLIRQIFILNEYKRIHPEALGEKPSPAPKRSKSEGEGSLAIPPFITPGGF